MIEIAICLAIIGFALVAIIGVLPLGMNTQRDNREATVINQDATVLLEAVRNAARGADYLTNNVYAITNQWTIFNADGTVDKSGINGYTYNTAYVNNAVNAYYSLTNGANIVGVLSTPEFTFNGQPFSGPFNFSYSSNHVVAYVRSFSGLASEKPPQAPDSIMVQNSFTYRVYCVNAAVAFDTNSALAGFNKQLNGNLHELRMTFLWPQLPNGNVGAGRQTFRTSVAGQLAPSPINGNLYYYQSQFFTNAP
jgi:type II secretory pathway pseudopilin PulG